MGSRRGSVNRSLREILSRRSDRLINPGFAVTLKRLVSVFFFAVSLVVASREVSPFIFSTSPAAVVVSVSVAIVLVVKSDIGGFWGLLGMPPNRCSR